MTQSPLHSSNNRLVKNSALEEQKYDFQVSTMRSKRLPHFQLSVLGGELLQPFDFTFAKGTFGTIRELDQFRQQTPRFNARRLTAVSG